MQCILIEREAEGVYTNTPTHTHESDVKKLAEIGVMQPQVKECQVIHQLLGAKKCKEQILL